MNPEIRIDKMGLHGQGVGHDDCGNIYFVPGAVTGDVVAVEPLQPAKRYRDARLVAVTAPSPDRVEPLCPYFGVCGGCDWLQLDYPAQLRAKDAMLTHVLERAGLRPEARLPIRGAAEVFGYRNRIQVRQEGDKVGFYRRGSHDIVDIERCLVAHPALNEALAELRREKPEGRRKIELYVTESGEVGRILNSRHGAAGFDQVNVAQNEALREMVADRVRAAGARRVLELYCGNGNLTFRYLPHVEAVCAVDSSRAAIDRARENQTEGAHFIAGEAGARVLRRLPEGFDYDTLVLDPPRSGAVEPLDGFLHDRLRSIIYVSCSPATFSQDVQCLKKDFVLRSVQAVDMFPHTRHIEFVSLFTRA